MKVSKGAMVVMKGQKGKGNIYKLLGNTIVGGAVAVTEFEQDDTLLWHMRLGHISERGMRELQKRNLWLELIHVSQISANTVSWESSVGCDSKQPRTRQRVYWIMYTLIFRGQCKWSLKVELGIL